ncbi:MAG: metallophosphoesterase family protein [Verrucomicrobiota bacterium]
MTSDLHFHPNGRFKIVQLTDIHWVEGSRHEERLLRIIGSILDAEKPDLVVLTGDIVHSPTGSLDGCRKVTAPMIERGIPWAGVLGNHDDEGDATRQEIASCLESLPRSLTKRGPAGLGACGNYAIDICKAGSDEAAARLYFLDSNTYSPLKSRGVDGYAWITHEQIQWFKSVVPPHPLPSLVFFHIPLPEYGEAWKTGVAAGRKGEDICSPRVNSGFFTALLEAGSVLGTFVGHDHSNDFAAMLHGICLTCGRSVGLDTYGDLERGARVIELAEGMMDFVSWIREESGNVTERFSHSGFLSAATNGG